MLIDDLEFTTVQKLWKRTGRYVTIKQFNPEDAESILESILKQKYFHNRTSFGTFVVSICVIDFEELYLLLDDMGVLARVAPPTLMRELYQLCYLVNEFFNYENVKKSKEKEC